MPSIRSVATALPPHILPQSTARRYAQHLFAPTMSHIDRYLPVFEHAQIEQRHLVVPPEWFLGEHSFQESNDLFIREATALGERVARDCLAAAGVDPVDVDHILWVSTTGIATPSPDAMLINRLGMRPHTRRTPLWGLGCAGGVAGLSRAYEYTRAFPQHRALLLNVELCSITFQKKDFSTRNLVAASLFADGATAVLVEGDHVSSRQLAGSRQQVPMSQTANCPQPTAGLEILGTQSTIWPDTLNIMGWSVMNHGLEVVFSTRIPGMVRATMHDTVAAFLAQHDLVIDDIEHWILHPGGAKVVQAYEAALAIDPERLAHTREVLRCYGNMSSATVFFVLERFLAEQQPQPGEYGLLAVLGPGFSCELALIQG
ncbi:MAG TPA: 3-oxoacyl-[acyl-carrier-protein] synthase III C-terminal domain-containing protein [Roseiflexaceae bacterium]|jgi:alkylresorcinol/alkylpyrone synthase|nr:3-oxoacyl-[acyl-carrier-protein] synthase III C-terminal domain-containing protein [Roseiflexaceae bacterium]